MGGLKISSNEKNMETNPCNLCKSNRKKILFYNQDFLLKNNFETFSYVQCIQCGLIYQDPRPIFEEIAKYYPDDYESYQYPGHNKPISILLTQAYAYGLRKRTKVVTRHKSHGKILDIGCSTGEFLNAMNQIGTWDPYGVEISPYAGAIAQKRHQLMVSIGTLEDAKFQDSSFDAVTLWDVLEHLHDPKKSLQEIRRVMKPDGILVIRIPNIDSWDAKLFGQFWAGFDAPRHLYVFGKKTIRRLLEENGFRIININSGIGSYPTFLLSLRFWLTQKSWNETQLQTLFNFLSSPIMRIITAPLFYLNSINAYGPLIVITAQKDPTRND